MNMVPEAVQTFSMIMHFYPLTEISSTILYRSICVNFYPTYVSIGACERVTSFTRYLEKLMMLFLYFATMLADWANWSDAQYNKYFENESKSYMKKEPTEHK